MGDFFARRIIEALRSGISSRDVGQCFSSARPDIMRGIYGSLQNLLDDRHSGGIVLTGKYGEGKTHLLNTVFNMAREQNMVVSVVTLSKETPLSSAHTIYQRAVQNAYLPGRPQPGLSGLFDGLTKGAPILAELCEYCLTGLETNRLYYVIKSYADTTDEDEKYALLGDIEGRFLTNAMVRRIFRRVHGAKADFNTMFAKTKHISDYYAFLTKIILAQGFNGWVLLFDEAELTGRLGKKSRLKAYENMSRLLKPERAEATFAIFAFNASYIPDVIDAKHEETNLEEALLPPEIKNLVGGAISRILNAPQLLPLERSEILDIFRRIRDYHGAAYGWEPAVEPEKLYEIAERHGYLLRTHIRTAVEMLDQQYQYGEYGDVRVGELGQFSFDEDGESGEEELGDFIPQGSGFGDMDDD